MILASLSVHGSLSVSDLARMVRSSDVTIRRDLRVLQDEGHVVRSRGGASIAKVSMDEPTYRDKTVVAPAEKLAIAREAASLVEDGEFIMLGAGTTTQALARMLQQRRVMVATNSLLVASELTDAAHVEVFVIGGVLRGNIRAMIGGDAERAIARMKLGKLFLSGNGLTAGAGLTTPNLHVASIDRAAAESAEQVIALVDHTKIGIESMVVTVPTERINTLVTDTGADLAEVAALRGAGIEVRCVPAAPAPGLVPAKTAPGDHHVGNSAPRVPPRA